MNDIVVTGWEDLSAKLYADTWNPQIQRFRSNFVYRGMSDCNFALQTSLMRLGGEIPEIERHLLRNFRKYAASSVGRDVSVWEWLAIAQHHGLPTRLLDWTYSPYVALHFATVEPDLCCDAVLWCVDFVGAHRLLPSKLRQMLSEEQSNAFTVDMLAQTVTSLDQLATVADDPYVIFFEPPSLDERIVNQFALFSMMSHARAGIQDWLDAHPELSRRLIITKSLKWEFRDKLDQANMTERVLFPGLDGLSRWWKRHYIYAATICSMRELQKTHPRRGRFPFPEVS